MPRPQLRNIPAVEKLLQALGPSDVPRPWVVSTVREELGRLRRAGTAANPADVLAHVRKRLDVLRRSRLQPVINGTGVLLHTNLGRAPLGAAARAALHELATGYSSLELDLESGSRGARGLYVEQSLALLCAAQAATVVNNCAAALVLILRQFTAGRRREVVISRGELIQIGGGFRIPDILETSGAVLREVGTTNRTTLEDYARACGPRSALILKVHRSNFRLEGFVESAPTPGLAALARKKRLPLVEDLGSGALDATERWQPLPHEPTPAESISQGVDLVCFSGDKLLGGPQAGLIVGRRPLVAALKRNPLFRALRCDKLVFAALQATLEAHLNASAQTPPSLPLTAMLSLDETALRARAETLARACTAWPVQASVGLGKAEVGGGTLPARTLPSITLDLRPAALSLEAFATRLRAGRPPVVGYVSGRRFRIDLRSVFPEQDAIVLNCIRQALVEPCPDAD